MAIVLNYLSDLTEAARIAREVRESLAANTDGGQSLRPLGSTATHPSVIGALKTTHSEVVMVRRQRKMAKLR